MASTASTSDHVESAAGASQTPAATQTPRTFDVLVRTIVDRRRFTLERLADISKTQPLNGEEEQLLEEFFGLLQTVDMTPELKDATLMDEGMEMVLDTAKHEFPDHFVELARNLHTLWMAQDWGARVEDDEEEEEEEVAESEDDGSQRTPSAGIRPLPMPPSADHPIYGANGIMRGILQIRTGRTSYRLDRSFPRRTATVFGHNNIAVGSWWPRQIAALRDGMHGRRVGGISGKDEEGAYSVVISRLYEDTDADRGDEVFYSGPNSHTNTDRDAPPDNKGTDHLRTSLESGRPVRVIRSGTRRRANSPSVGLRYDGLYTVVDCSEATNGRGGLYLRFRMQRCPGQDPIDLSRPTPEEVQSFNLVKDGY